MTLQAIIRQLNIIDGVVQPQDVVPGLMVQSAPSGSQRSRQRDKLLLHLTLDVDYETGSGLYNMLSMTIVNRFYTTGGSVTAALRDAVKACNEALIANNARPNTIRAEGSLVCAVTRGSELFMAQVGDAFAIVGHNFGVERLPTAQPEIATPLGRQVSVDIRYFHNWVQEGDTVLLGGPRLAYTPTQIFVPALSGTNPESAENQLTSILQQQSARILLLFLSRGQGSDVPAAKPIPSQQPSAAPMRRAPVRDPAYLAAETALVRSSGQSAESVSGAAAATTIATSDEDDDPEGVGLEYTSRRAAAKTLGGLSLFTGWVARVLARLHSPDIAGEDPEHPGERTWAIIIAILIPIAVAVILSGVYMQRGDVSQLSQLRQDIRAAFAEAETAVSLNEDPRPYYESVFALADEAMTLNPDDPDIIAQRRAAQVALDRLDNVTRLFGTTLYSADAASQFEGVTLSPDPKTGLFLLDRGNRQVVWLPTDSDYTALTGTVPETILRWNDVIGSHVVGGIVDMLWRNNASEVGRPGLAMLDASGAVVTYNPTLNPVLHAAPLNLSSQWSTPVGMTDFQGRVYVLDPGSNRIWRYFPDSDEFTIEGGREAIELDDLALAVDSEIYEKDGSVLLVFSDGDFRQYTGDTLNWDETRLATAGLDQPLIAPSRVKIIGDGFSSSIFVADPATARIIELGPSGNVLAQYKATREDGTELFADMNDFDVAPTLSDLRIFVVSDGVLSVATFSQ